MTTTLNPPLWTLEPEPEDDLEALRAASAANVAATEGDRVEAWLAEIRANRKDEPLKPVTRNDILTPETMNIPEGAVNMNTPKKSLKISDLFPSKWLRATDLTRPVTVRIATAELVEVYDKQHREYTEKLALGFQTLEGKPLRKRMLVNKTNAYKLAEICGSDDAANWPGCVVTLKPGQSHNRKPTILVEAGRE